MPIHPHPAPLHWFDRLTLALAALLGAMGVSLAAAEAHLAQASALHSAALLALVTAPACLALVTAGYAGLLAPVIARGLAFLLGLGSFLFGLSLSTRILGPLLPQDHSLKSPMALIAQIPMLAPFGGSLMILAWILCACAAF
jgi:uncharacterized membrane protein YgdD (TMEM256/DUF423 family)